MSDKPQYPDAETSRQAHPKPGPHAAFPATGVSDCPVCGKQVDRMMDHRCAAMKPSQAG